MGTEYENAVKVAWEKFKAGKLEETIMLTGETFKNPPNIIADCPSCDTRTSFIYVGYQEGVKGFEGSPLYECKHCETSHLLRSLI